MPTSEIGSPRLLHPEWRGSLSLTKSNAYNNAITNFIIRAFSTRYGAFLSRDKCFKADSKVHSSLVKGLILKPMP